MLATFIWKTFGRCCSSNVAVFFSAFALLKVAWACCFSSIFALMMRCPILISTPWMAARVEAGKTYTASMGVLPVLV